MNRKQVLPQPQRNIRSEFAYQPYPKSNEKPSIAVWATRGRGQNGESITGGNTRAISIAHQFVAR